MLAVCGKEKTSDLLTTSYVVSRRENVVRIPSVSAFILKNHAFAPDFFILCNCVFFKALEAWRLKLVAFFFFFLFGQALARLYRMELVP